MWHWDQGHLEYFQFDAIRSIARFVVHNDIRESRKEILEQYTGLSFAVPSNYAPWRNYSRALKLCLLVNEDARPTPIANVLSQPGMVTCDEYFHFLICSFTDPSPALSDWKSDSSFRYPLLFALKYLLAKVSIGDDQPVSFDELIGAFKASSFTGDEDQSRFISIIGKSEFYGPIGQAVNRDLRRQARESLLVMAQVSYLHVSNKQIVVSLNSEDAKEIFEDLSPIIGPREKDKNSEIQRLASLFEGGSTNDDFNYPNTIISQAEDSGFFEGNKVKKTHIVIERNAGIRREFFNARPTAICDVCSLDTAKTYPWTDVGKGHGVIDVHHLLPLCSGTRVKTDGTTFDDLVPVCPNCHRAIHRFYDVWLGRENRIDFESKEESRDVYNKMKMDFKGLKINV